MKELALRVWRSTERAASGRQQEKQGPCASICEPIWYVFKIVQ
jgi:hypothetical protein